MEKKVCLTEKEVLENPNNITLGELVRKKYWELEQQDKEKPNDSETRKGVSK